MATGTFLRAVRLQLEDMKAFKLAFWAAFTAILVIVSVNLIWKNGEPISVSLFDYTSESYPKWLVLMVATFIGVLLASVFFIVELIILETKNLRLRRANQKLERALAHLTAQQTGIAIAVPGENGVDVKTSLATELSTSYHTEDV